MSMLEMEAKDSLLEAKVLQANQANAHRTITFPFKVGDCMMRSTLHCQREYKSNKTHHAAKFMPHFDGPYTIIATDEAHSTVTLDLPDNPCMFPMFHTSKVHLFTENDDNLFPDCALHPPNPIVVDGQKEFFIDKIINERRWGHRQQYQVWWLGEGLEGNEWVATKELEDCKVLDKWQQCQGLHAIVDHTSSNSFFSPAFLLATSSFPHRGFDAPKLSTLHLPL
jgi:hypothetical protein